MKMLKYSLYDEMEEWMDLGSAETCMNTCVHAKR